MKDPVKFQLWAKYMQLVYGSTPPEEAFVSQTYLMVLVRVLLAKRLTNGAQFPPRDALNGKLFSSQGIQIIEDDFFSWILNTMFWGEIKSLLETMMQALDSYDLDNIDEDIFKEIYQEIVKQADRHRLGEYYTPEWLAELTIKQAIDEIDPKRECKSYSVLDPACGSGTFLTNMISLLKKNGCSLEDILRSVYGIDLNPMAVTIARANYLLALGKLVESRQSAIFIPVFMADSIKLPETRKEFQHGIDVLVIDADKKIKLDLPKDIALNDVKLKRVLTVFNDVITEYKAKRLTPKQVLKTFENSYDNADRNSVDVLKHTLGNIILLIDDSKDSVWLFMMRNIYAPLRMQEKNFDLVIGNPPWISLKYIENSSYQNFIKNEAINYHLLESRQTELFTQMDTATVFYCRAADLYLSKNGILAFVLPRSVLTGAKQHIAFQDQEKPQMKILTIIDAEKVKPLFKVPACSIIAQKNEPTKYPVKSLVVEGQLPEKNLRLHKAMKVIHITDGTYTPPHRSETLSPYHSKVVEGASIVPRTLWFVKFVSSTFGVNPDTPLVESLVLPDAKLPWKNLIMKGEVESKFLFVTTTGKKLLPFKAKFLPIVLPVERGELKLNILTPDELRRKGYLKMANWVDEAQGYWSKTATKTSLKNLPNVMNRVNYHNLLTDQKQNLRYFIIQTGSGSNIAAAVVDTKKIPQIVCGKAKISPVCFIADYTTFWFATNSVAEAYYLTAILNSNVINNAIKKNQPKGDFGPRHICRLAFEQNIPRFDRENDLHRRIAVFGVRATREASHVSETSRTKTKEAITAMASIDKLVSRLIG
jgi:SAM-dependent methyltransferase